MRGPQQLWIALAALVIAACGSSGPGSTATTGNSPADLSSCMRANGISDFPDPRAGPSGSVGLSITATPGSETLTVEGITFGGPAFEHAEKACKTYLQPKGPPPPLSATRRAQELAFAKCMRAHGVANFPDPPTSSGGPVVKQASTINPNEPAVQRAAAACGRP